MARIVVFCKTSEEEIIIREQLAPILETWEEPPFYREFVGDRPGFLKYVKGNPYLTMLIVQSGSEGKETVRLAKQMNSKAELIWFAEEDYALDAFAIHITHFDRLPVNYGKLVLAFKACQLLQDGPYTSTVTV